jgi:flagellar basal-body rod protein FlgG
MAYLALQIAATGMHTNQTKVDVISGNLANMSTTAYKESDVSFEDLMYLNYKAPGSATSSTGTLLPSSMQIGLGSKVSSITRSFDQGGLILTDSKPLNLAVQGDGFLQITLPSGDIAYTRDGELAKSATGDIVTKLGYPIIPAMTIPDDATDITIALDGTVSVTVDGTSQILGQIELAKFLNPAGLEAMGGNLYSESDASGDPLLGPPNLDGFGAVMQYQLESSNVDSISQIVELINAQRGYEYCSKCLQTADQMSKTEVETKI